MKSVNSKKIWLINIGELLPTKGGRHFRMSIWKNWLCEEGYDVLFFTTDFEHQRKVWLSSFPPGYIKLRSRVAYKKNIGFLRIINHVSVAIDFYKQAHSIKEKPNVIIVSYPTILLAYVAVRFAQKNNIKVFVDVRDKWPDIFLPYSYLRWILFPLNYIKKKIFKSSRCIAISPEYYKWATKKNKIDNEYILPLSINLNNIPAPIANKLGTRIKFIFSGTLGVTYDLDFILRLYDLLIENKILFEIIVCGDGPKRNTFLSDIKSRVFITYKGWVDQETLNKDLSEAHFGLMFYHPDAPQGWPNKLIEYTAYSLPIINTLKGEAWTLINDKQIGYNIDSENFEDCIEFIKRVSEKEEFLKYSFNSNRCYLENFSNHSVKNKLLKLIESE